MKKITFSFVAIIVMLTNVSFGQSLSCDTLRNYLLTDDLYEIGGPSGDLLGHDILTAGTDLLPVRTWAEPYSLGATTSQVRQLRFIPYKAHSVGGSVTFNVYTDVAGLPGTVVQSETVPITDFTPNQYYELNFNTPANITGNFWVGYDLTYTVPQDTFAILGTFKPGGTNYTQFYLSDVPYDGWYEVDAIYSIGTDALISAWALDVMVSDGPDPVADITSINDDAVCLGTNFEVDGSGSTNTDYWEWFLTDNPPTTTIDSETGTSAILEPTTTGDHAIYLIAHGSCRTDIAAEAVFVDPPVSATVSTANEICGQGNGSITFSNPQGGFGTYEYSIDGVNYVTTATFNGLTAGPYTVYVRTDGDGCETSYNVTVNETLAQPITVGGPQTICSGNTVGITASGTGTIEWFDGATSVGTTPTISVSPTTTTVYTAVLTDANGCASSGNVTVTVNPTPSVDAGANQAICEGDPITLTATNPDGAAITWNNGVNDGVAFTPTNTATYQVTAVLGTCTAIDNVTITVNPTPTVDAGTNQTICEGDAITLTATNPDGAAINWDNGINDGVSFTPSNTTTYEVTAILGSCSSTDDVTIIVNPTPTVDAGTNQSICDGDVITLTATNPDGATITWDNGVNDGVAFTPTNTTTYEVTAILGSCSSTDEVTITVNPTPTVDAGTNQTICDGDAITLTATNPDGAVITWDNGVNDGVSFNPNATITYEVTATLGSCSETDNVTITVNPLPSVTASPDETICVGDNVTISVTGDANTYSWDNGLGNATSHIVSPATTTTYQVTGVDGNNCENTDVVIVNVNQIDDASFTFNNFCEGSTNQATSIALPGGSFDFNPAPGDGAIINSTTGEITNGVLGTTYSVEYTTNGPCPSSSIETVTVQSSDDSSFDFDDICLGSPALPSNIATPGGSFNFFVAPTDGATINPSTGEILNPIVGNSYQVEYTTPTGVCQSSEVVTVNTFALPTVSASADQTICDGDVVVISVSGADTYNWDNSLGAGDTHSVNPSTNTTYTVVGTDGNGCSASDAVTIDVNPTPTVEAGNDETICEGTSITLTAFNPDGATLTWDNDVVDGVTFTPTNTATYQVSAVLGTCTAIDNVTITVTDLPTVSAGDDIEACDGDLITLTAINPNGAVISWDNSVLDGVPFAATVGTITYTVTANLSGCIATDEVDVTVNTLPSVSMGSNEEMCNTAGIFSLTGTPTGGIFAGPGVTGNEFDPNTAGVGNHTITYIFEDANGCSNTASAVYSVDDCVSLTENNLSNSLILAPNPSSTHIDIIVSGDDLIISSIQLISLEGRVLDVQNNSAIENTIRVDVSSYAKGTYMAIITTSKGVVNKKFIVQ